MKSKSNSYWENRAIKRMEGYHKSNDVVINKINYAYDKAINDINQDIKKIFHKYKIDSGLTTEEARQLLNSTIPIKELDSIRARIHGIQDEDLKKYMMAQLNADAYKARITRLEALKESIYINTKVAADVEMKESTKLYSDNIKESYYKNIFDIQQGLGVGFNVAQMPLETVQEILKNNWSGKHYSERIWGNTDVLAQKLEDIITSGLMSGKSSRRMAEELSEISGYGKFAAERLIRTETTYITNMADIESYKECGIEKYIFIATLDLRTSSICRQHDGKVYDVSEASPGSNLPALHPYCRSTTRAYLEDEELSKIERSARDPETGKTYLVPANMNYEDWHDKFVVDKYGKEKTEAFEKMVKNKASDRNQFNRYKEILREDSPKTLKDFQELKYNNIKEWNLTRYNYTLKSKIFNGESNLIPNSDKFYIDERKFTNYIFGGTNEAGLAKGRAFTSRLGYDINNFTELDKIIKSKIKEYPAIHKGSTPHGDKYEINMVIRGTTGKQAKVKVGAMVDGKTSKLSTVFIDKLKEGEING